MVQLLTEDSSKEAVTPQPLTATFDVLGDNIIPLYLEKNPNLRIGDLDVQKNKAGTLAIKITRNDSLGIKIKPIYFNDTRTDEHPYPRILEKQNGVELKTDDFIIKIPDSRDGIIPALEFGIDGVEFLRFRIKADTVGDTPATVDFARFVTE